MPSTRDRQNRLHFKDLAQGVKLFLRFNKYILRYWKVELVILILGNLSMLLGLLNPYIGKLILDKGIMAKDINSLVIFSLLAAGIFLVSLIFSAAFDYLKNYSVIKVETDLTREVFRKIKNYSLSQIQELPSSIYLFRITNDITSVSNIINVTLIHFISSLLKIIFITAIILFINPLLLLIILAYQFLAIIRLNLLVKPIQELNKLSLEKAENIYQKLNIFFSHIYLFKAFGTLGNEAVKYLHSLFDSLRLNMKSARLRGVSGFLSSLSDKLFFGFATFCGAIFVIKGQMSLGTLAAAIMYISQGVEAYSTLTSMVEQLILNKVSFSRVAALLDQSPASFSKNQDGLRPVDIRRIEFKDITFGHQSDRKLLNKINFVIEAGTKIGLVGYSGCGKTTLISLLLGLYTPESGEIKINDTNLENIDSKHFLNQVGIALQEPFLFDDTIINNISYAAREISKGETLKAAQVSDLVEFIDSLPQGLETVIGENAYRISQGQKQRVAIARAIIRNPQILILDEAMSSLDPRCEAKIISSLKEKFNKSTIIVVSHRLTVMENMDLVYFFQSPNVIRIGTHKDLLDSVLEYKEFFGKQKEIGANLISS
jgi:ABC-type bacteriocin/lantibiotic exporter with double-glycine peptidase domain